jgi:hypothetical protein
LSWLRSSALVFLLVLGIGGAAADDAIQISAVRHPVDKSYRKMVKGMDLFEEMHRLAPKAELRYRLYPRKPGADLRVGRIYVVSEDRELPVPVAADNTFTLRRDLPEDSIVRSERRADTLTWRADIRTPGLPANTRRLGDLRLECLVGVQAGLISQYPGFISQFLSFLQSPREFCGRAEVPYLFFADRPLFGVTLHKGERRQALSVGNLYAGIAHGRTPAEERKYCDCEALLDRAYTLPLGDSSWPDDTLVELDYMPPRAAAGGAYEMFLHTTKADVRAALGAATEIRFDNGYELWAYDFGPPQKPRLAHEELVLLFDSSGGVLAVRHRQ